MDNITHALAGMLVAEGALSWRRETRQSVRAAAYLASATANNLPDIDIVYTWITGPKPLGSLLHHRGHTHTLLLALPAAFLLGRWMCRFLARRRVVDASERSLLLALWLAGPVLHLTLDWGNNYGIHPFWPLSSRWFYGDSIFIIEPLWWAVSIPILAARLRRRWLKWLLWASLSGILILGWFVPFVLPVSRWVLLGLTGAAALLGARAPERTAVALALGAWVAIATAFRFGSLVSKERLLRASETAFPALTVHDISASPLPANPSCWETLLVGEQGGEYRVLRASVALWPLPAERCSAGLDVEPTARVTKLERPVRDGVRWISEYRAPLSELRLVARQDCRFRALLQFARVPYLSQRYAGDLRYDRDEGLEFAELELPADPGAGQCPRFLTAWHPPRAALLR